MSIITRNDYGAIAVNNKVLAKMIVGELLSMSDVFIPCTKKGKIIKQNPTPFIDPDYYDSLEINESKTKTGVKVYCFSVSGDNISEDAEHLIDRIESVYDLFKLEHPHKTTIRIKGVASNPQIKKAIEVSRINE